MAVDAEAIDLPPGGLHERRAVLGANTEIVEEMGLVHPRAVGVEDAGLEAVFLGEQCGAQTGRAAANDTHRRVSVSLTHSSYERCQR